MTLTKAPDQSDTERLLSQVLERGDQTALASLMEVSPSEICQQFTPSNPKQSVYYRFKRQMWALYCVNRKAARVINADFQSAFEAWERPDGKSESLATLVITAHRESSEVIESWAAGKPLHEQRKETVEAIAALQRHLEGLDRQGVQLREAGR